MKYFETSAKLNKNIDELMAHLMEEVYKKMFASGEKRMESIMIKKTDKDGRKTGKNGSGGGCSC